MSNGGRVHVLVVAKQSLPGRVKTRLIPGFGAEGAAALASAALADTLEAALACRADHVVVAFDGDPTGIVPDGIEVTAQRSGDFPTRLAGAWADAGGPGIQIGMDTPQVTATDLDQAMDALAKPGTDAVLGLADDGGWWAIGLHAPVPGLFSGIATSRSDTGTRQRDRLVELGLATSMLAPMRDVDTPADADAVAALAPSSHFARVLGELRRERPAPELTGSRRVLATARSTTSPDGVR
ncbi:MAG: TIGR04282 family arsenosugar biosynthesis glycosyltransferase [Acidimicrobiales bacterium]